MLCVVEGFADYVNRDLNRISWQAQSASYFISPVFIDWAYIHTRPGPPSSKHPFYIELEPCLLDTVCLIRVPRVQSIAVNDTYYDNLGYKRHHYIRADLFDKGWMILFQLFRNEEKQGWNMYTATFRFSYVRNPVIQPL